MNQPNLFDRPVYTVPRARRADPTSSHAAADRMEQGGKLKSDQSATLECIRAHPGLTTRQLAETERAKAHGLDRYDIGPTRAGTRRAGADLSPAGREGIAVFSEDVESSALRIELTRRIECVRATRGATLDDVARDTGLHKNRIFRALAGPDSRYWGPNIGFDSLDRLRRWAGIVWADLEPPTVEVCWADVERMVSCLEELPPDSRELLADLMRAAYLRLAKGGGDAE